MIRWLNNFQVWIKEHPYEFIRGLQATVAIGCAVLILTSDSRFTQFIIGDLTIPRVPIGLSLLAGGAWIVYRRPRFGNLTFPLLPMYFLFLYQGSVAFLYPGGSRWLIMPLWVWVFGTSFLVWSQKLDGTIKS